MRSLHPSWIRPSCAIQRKEDWTYTRQKERKKELHRRPVLDRGPAVAAPNQHPSRTPSRTRTSSGLVLHLFVVSSRRTVVALHPTDAEVDDAEARKIFPRKPSTRTHALPCHHLFRRPPTPDRHQLAFWRRPSCRRREERASFDERSKSSKLQSSEDKRDIDPWDTES